MDNQQPAELKLPPGWLFACLTFWGIATAQAVGAITCAALLSLHTVVAQRWALQPRHYVRLADLSSAGFVVLVGYLFTEYGVLAIYRVLAAFPWVLLPLAFAQAYGVDGRIPRSAFIMSLRKHPETVVRPVDLRPALGATCLIAASPGVLAVIWYGSGVTCLLLALFLVNRNSRYNLGQWSLSALVALSLAVGTYLAIVRAQLATSDLLQSLIGEWGFISTDLDQTSTAIGAIGRLKLSDKIRLRIATSRNIPLPLRLTEARYQEFENGIWSNRGPGPITIDPSARSLTWNLQPATAATRQITITTERQQELGALALPASTVQLSGDDLLEVQRHTLGGVIAEARPGFLRYRANYLSAQVFAGAPSADDLSIPEAYQPVLSRIAGEAHAMGLKPLDAVLQIEKFFAQNFRYSLIQPGYFPGRKPLVSFLLGDRAGHCEYFATATTLLLRQSGIPARYAVGYLVDEYSAREQAFVARARHAHAWAEAFVAGEWRVVDTTPGLWLEAEAFRGFPWHLIGDTINWMRWQLQRVQRGELALDTRGLLAVPLLLGWLFWRLRPLARARQLVVKPGSGTHEQSELRPLFAALARRGIHPRPGETTLDFLTPHWPPSANRILHAMVMLHYAERYRHTGLSVEERSTLRQSVATLLNQIGQNGL